MRWVLADDSSNPTYHVRVSTDMDELGIGALRLVMHEI